MKRTEHIPWRKAKWFYLFISPWLLGFIFLTTFPLVAALVMSFSNFNGINLDTARFVGIQNYADIFHDAEAVYALGRTGVFMLINVPLGLIISLCLALMLTQKIFAQGIFRTLFYIPSILPVVAVAWIWKLMMDNNFGLVNTLLDALFPGTYVRWMTVYPTQVLTMMSVWGGVGGGIIIFMAALQGVPKELEEAARMDGANFLDVFRAVTVPFITPVIFYQLVLGIIGTLQVLIQPMLLAATPANANLSVIPPRENLMFVVYAFQQIFTMQRYGYGSALLWVLFALILILTLVVVRTSRYWVFYEVEQEGSAR